MLGRKLWRKSGGKFPICVGVLNRGIIWLKIAAMGLCGCEESESARFQLVESIK